jgi:serine/threonine protein kinase
MCEYERNNAVNEVRILASLDHPNIIKFVSGLFDSNEDDLYLFMEYAAEGDLAALIEQARERKKRISEAAIWNILLQMAEGNRFAMQGWSTSTGTTSSTAISNPPTSSRRPTASTNWPT